jgi:transposase
MGMKDPLLRRNNVGRGFTPSLCVPGATAMSSLFVFVGLDYHQDSIRVCVMGEDGQSLVNRNVANDPVAVQDLISQFGHPRGIAIEACCGAADFAQRLTEQAEWTVKLAHPGYVRRLKQSPDKSDHDDAALLADLVRVNYLPEVWLADEKTRQLRRLVCYRRQVQRASKDLKLQLRSLLREERIGNAPANPWTAAWLDWLKTNATLSPSSRWIVDRQLTRLAELTQELKQVEQELQRQTSDDPLMEKLLTQPGIGLVTAVTLRAEIGTIRRFRTGKQLARFCGITPCNASSGQRQADAGLVRAGSPELRALLIQVAHVVSRHVPQWKNLNERLRQSKPGNVAKAAIANRWVRWLFHQLQEAPSTDEELGPSQERLRAVTC